ncbi:MAG: hypothetical protein ABIN91_21625 [Mucilaginibacter sp.]|uniref:hypothetical protein n=1 Tax=Mucilaginibacter sp. TaxID=1882438 RepID=UPI003263B172
MMKTISKLAVTALMLIISIHTTSAQKTDLSNNNCQNTIGYSISEYGQNGKTRLAATKGNNFNIIVSPAIKPVNFVSSIEQYYRSQARQVDTSIFYLIKSNWKKLSPTQKLDVIEKEKTEYELRANAAHKANNTNHQLIYMVNNTDHDVALQMQDYNFIGVLEAKITESTWRSVQYIMFSKCGNSYVLKHIAPDSTAYFITPIPTGNYKTTLRYKILGKDNFYYSNKFEGNITYCDLYDTKHTPIEKLETYKKYYID